MAGAAFLALLVASGVASAASFDPPKRKSGLWEIKMSSTQAKGMPAIQECIDEKTDDLMQQGMAGMEDLSCSKNEMRKQGDTIVAESVCTVNGSTAKTRAVFTGRFDSAYKADIHSTYEPPLLGMREASWVLEAQWLGPCKPGQKPGDVAIPGMPPGMPNINVDELMKRTPKKP
jgi:hypothetical protein